MARLAIGDVVMAMVVLSPLTAGDLVLAQEREPLTTDRPGVVVGADTLPRGVWQVEAGVDYARESNADARTRRGAVVVTVNYGLLDTAELLLEGEPVVVLRGDEEGTGLGDTVLGVKVRLVEGVEGSARPTLALLPSVKLPTARSPIGTTRVDGALLGLVTWGFARFDLTLNAGLAVLGDRDGPLPQALAVAAIQTGITSRLQGLGEVFFNSREEREGRARLGMTLGAAWLVWPALALDAGVQTTLAGRGPDYVLRAGFSARFWP